MNKVNYLISLDYELFFGTSPGSVQNCMLIPTKELVKVLDRHNSKVCLFVDAGFLVRLKDYSEHFPELTEQRKEIHKQLLALSAAGHDIQLHIHPHWIDSTYDQNGWKINTQRYRLHDFSATEIEKIVYSYKAELQQCSHQPIFAYRAGGWCLQPFKKIKEALLNNGIWLDSTVFSQGYSSDPTRHFNFKSMPKLPYWRFSDDPLQPNESGEFIELPISAYKTSPLFFWKLAFHKKFSSQKFTTFGDGQAMVANKQYYLQRLTQTTYGPVMLDGAKAGQLQNALKKHMKNQHSLSIFNIMGHPKSLTPYSLDKLEQFLKNDQSLQCKTFQDLLHLKD